MPSSDLSYYKNLFIIYYFFYFFIFGHIHIAIIIEYLSFIYNLNLLNSHY